MEVTLIRTNKELRKWLDGNDHLRLSIDTETAPSKVDYGTFIITWDNYLNKKMEPQVYKAEAKKQGKDPEAYKRKLWDDAMYPFRCILIKVSSIDQAREATKEIIEILDIKKSPINIEDYYEGGPKAALRYHYLEAESIQLYNGENACYIDLVDNPNKEKIIQVMRYALQNDIKILYIHNAPFDLSVLDKLGIGYKSIDSIFIYDTMVGDHLINERRRHGLKFLAKEILGQEETTTYTEARAKGLDSVEWLKYAINDVVWVWDLMEYQKPIMEDEGLKNLYCKIEAPYQWALVQMKVEGMVIDDEVRIKLRDKAYKLYEEFFIKLCNMSENKYDISFNKDGTSTIASDFNPNSAQQIAKLLTEKFKVPLTKTTPKGTFTVGTKEIDRFKKEFPFIDILIKFKAIAKLLNTYLKDEGQIKRNIDGDGRVRPSIRDTGTATGRNSMAEPNMQQSPSDKQEHGVEVRECIVAPDGYKLISIDFSGQENIILGVVTKDEALKTLLENRGDLHLANANAAFNLNIPEEEMFKSNPKYEDHIEKYGKLRKQSKSITFLMPYGGTAYGLSSDMRCSEEDAQKYIDNYFEKFPGVLSSMKDAEKFVEDNGYISTMFGRRRRFDKIEMFGKEIYPMGMIRKAFNMTIQGAAADMTRMGVNSIYKYLKEQAKFGANMVCVVHDEVLLYCKEEWAEECAKGVQKCMNECVKLSIKHESEYGIGDSYATGH